MGGGTKLNIKHTYFLRNWIYLDKFKPAFFQTIFLRVELMNTNKYSPASAYTGDSKYWAFQSMRMVNKVT